MEPEWLKCRCICIVVSLIPGEGVLRDPRICSHMRGYRVLGCNTDCSSLDKLSTFRSLLLKALRSAHPLLSFVYCAARSIKSFIGPLTRLTAGYTEPRRSEVGIRMSLLTYENIQIGEQCCIRDSEAQNFSRLVCPSSHARYLIGKLLTYQSRRCPFRTFCTLVVKNQNRFLMIKVLDKCNVCRLGLRLARSSVLSESPNCSSKAFRHAYHILTIANTVEIRKICKFFIA